MAPQQEIETLEGTVTAVIYQNPENGYTVLRVKSKQGSQTVVGELADVSVGETVLATGVWVDHPSFGPQFKAATLETSIPTEQNGIYEYLASGVIKGIGKQTARRIVDRFGAETLSIIESQPERLAEVRGITLTKAKTIQGEFLQKAGMRRLVEFLTGFQLPVSLALALWRRYADRAIDILRADPYLILDEELGVRFADADRIAASCGIGPEDLLRVEAGIHYTLTHNLGNGHCFLPKDRLLEAAKRLLALEDDGLLAEGLDALRLRGKVVLTPVANVEAVYLAELYENEQYIVERVAQMCHRELLPPKNLEQLIDRVEAEQHLTYAPEQRQAVRMAAQSQIMLLTGGPGTGKTTSLRGILGLFEMLGLKTQLAAPTGRAAKRLGELCGAEASTIHRLLEAGYDPGSGQLAFQRDEDEPLKCQAVIVDETSMVDVPLMAALLAALPNDCRLVLVGDPDQLPSVGPGQVFDHLIRSELVPITQLTTIFRQAQQSRIIMNAHGVNHGQPPVLRNEGGDFFFLRRKDAQSAVDTIVELCKTRLPEKMGIPSDQIQVLSPTRKYLTGTANLNTALQAALNPPSPERPEKRHGSTTFRVGDRVMQIRNNYDVLWRAHDGLKGGMGVFNGDVGLITDITPEGDITTVNFDGHIVEYTPDMLGELESAYAMTVHKSQGSEYRAVILAAVNGAPMLLTRGVLYTAITRAKELLIIVGDEEVIYRMTANDRQTRRYSGVRYLLTQAL
jgi:exodeoxyribonuclease V alpha subunit